MAKFVSNFDVGEALIQVVRESYYAHNLFHSGLLFKGKGKYKYCLVNCFAIWYMFVLLLLFSLFTLFLPIEIPDKFLTHVGWEPDKFV